MSGTTRPIEAVWAEEGDVVTTSDGQKWRVNRIEVTRDRDGHPLPVAHVSHVVSHIEITVPCADVTVFERHPGGPR